MLRRKAEVSLKRLVLIAALCGGGVVAYQALWRQEKTPMSAERSITAVLSGQLSVPLGGPENISTIPLYHVHKNLWATLLSSHGKPAVARLLAPAEGGTLYSFEILPDARFSNGRSITSSDVEFSLQRLMRKQESGHFSARSMIDRIDIVSPSRFKIVLKHSAPTFLFLLSSPETGIVPREACDEKGNLLRLDITSGAYAVEGAPEVDRIVLKRNGLFEDQTSSSPAHVTVLFRNGSESIGSSAIEQRADFFEVSDNSRPQSFEKIRALPGYDHKVTRPSLSWFLVADSNKLTRPQRVSISSLIQSKLAQYYQLNSEIEVRSYEILPPGTVGSLRLSAPKISPPKVSDLPKRLRLGVTDPQAMLTQAVAKILEAAQIQVEFSKLFDAGTYDIGLWAQGMNADFPEIEFFLSLMGPYSIIRPIQTERELIVQTLQTDNFPTRQGLLQKVGHSLLDDGRVIPLVVRAYAHYYRKDRLTIDQVTTYDGDIPFWKMQVLSP
jgi:hypothetical protein